MLLSRPTVQIASSRISKTSSLRATNRADKFSACAKWGSKRSSSDSSTQYRMSGSVRRRQSTVEGSCKKTKQWEILKMAVLKSWIVYCEVEQLIIGNCDFGRIFC